MIHSQKRHLVSLARHFKEPSQPSSTVELSHVAASEVTEDDARYLLESELMKMIGQLKKSELLDQMGSSQIITGIVANF